MKIESFLKKSVIVPCLFSAAVLEKKLQDKFASLGISVLEGLVLVSIFFEGRECRPSELASSFHTSRARLSQILSTLVEMGLIERELERSDARFLSLKITNRGRIIAQKAVGIFDRVNGEVEAQLGVRHAEKVAEQLHSLQRELRSS